jgi:hypothetical protein
VLGDLRDPTRGTWAVCAAISTIITTFTATIIATAIATAISTIIATAISATFAAVAGSFLAAKACCFGCSIWVALRHRGGVHAGVSVRLRAAVRQ